MSNTSAIVPSPVSNSGIVKVQIGNTVTLSVNQRDALQLLELSHEILYEPAGNDFSFAEQAMKRKIIVMLERPMDYIDLSVLITMPNMCKWVFYQSGYAL